MHIHYVAFNSYRQKGFAFTRMDGMMGYLFVYFKTPTLLQIRDDSYTISEPGVVIIEPYTPFKYTPLTENYYDDYIHFSPKDESNFSSKLHFPLNIPIKISNDMCISPITKAISQQHRESCPFMSDIQYHHIMLLILRIAEEWIACNQINPDTPYFQRLTALRTKIHESPSKQWRIQEMANEVMLSPAYFQILYKQAFGVTCMTDVIQTKIQTAKKLLTSTDMLVSEIADELGYNQVYHFIRQFKKITGMTPGAFRKMTQ